MRELIYGVKYISRYLFTGKTAPLICGLVLHNDCNLRCRHCSVVQRPSCKMSFDEITRVIDSYYDEGGRCLYLEGGEPFTWKEEAHVMEDIVYYAKKKGYLTVIIYTNGTIKLDSQADTIFVSIDGLKKTHDALRGRSFDLIMKNIESSTHPSIYVNYTINSANKTDVAAFCSYVHDLPKIKGIFFYFHTPYYGYDDLFLDNKEKTGIIKEIISLKKKYSILNSVAGLRSAIRNDWKRNLDICKVYENGKYYSCCRESNNGETCIDCGYLSYAEIDQVLKLKPGAIINALKYF